MVNKHSKFAVLKLPFCFSTPPHAALQQTSQIVHKDPRKSSLSGLATVGPDASALSDKTLSTAACVPPPRTKEDRRRSCIASSPSRGFTAGNKGQEFQIRTERFYSNLKRLTLRKLPRWCARKIYGTWR